MREDKDDAVSTVIALVLILAILATCIAIYSATYVPGLKQQAEIAHSEEVKYAFERFSADVDNIYSLGKVAQFTEPLPLGGGDVLLSPVRSSGTIEIGDPVEVAALYVAGTPTPIRRVNVTYMPSYSSWELQGYRWENGVVWVTKGAKETPASLLVRTIGDGKDKERGIVNESLSKMSKDLVVISMDKEESSSITGTGIAKLRLNAVELEPIPVSAGQSVEIVSSGGGGGYPLPSGDYTIRHLSIGVSVE